MSKKRVHLIDVKSLRILEHTSIAIQQAMKEQCYLVGSVLETPEYRDVDVRMIFEDEKFEKLFGEGSPEISLFWSLVCTALGEYMSNRTGLPIDFQIQKRSRISEEDWNKERVPLGVFPSNITPQWMEKPKPELKTKSGWWEEVSPENLPPVWVLVLGCVMMKKQPEGVEKEPYYCLCYRDENNPAKWYNEVDRTAMEIPPTYWMEIVNP